MTHGEKSREAGSQHRGGCAPAGRTGTGDMTRGTVDRWQGKAGRVRKERGEETEKKNLFRLEMIGAPSSERKVNQNVPVQRNAAAAILGFLPPGMGRFGVDSAICFVVLGHF